MRKVRNPDVSLGIADENTGHKDERTSEDDLRYRRPETQLEVAKADIADGEEFDADDKVREIQRGRKVGDKEWERVENAADEGRYPDDTPADGGVPTAGVLTRVREALGKCH